jgi:hypothetical protein
LLRRGLGHPRSNQGEAMKALTTVAMYGLLPVPSMRDTQAFSDNGDRLPMAGAENAALLARYRHLATKGVNMRARQDLEDLGADVPAQADRH